jgi:hypothetical protein
VIVKMRYTTNPNSKKVGSCADDTHRVPPCQGQACQEPEVAFHSIPVTSPDIIALVVQEATIIGIVPDVILIEQGLGTPILVWIVIRISLRWRQRRQPPIACHTDWARRVRTMTSLAGGARTAVANGGSNAGIEASPPLHLIQNEDAGRVALTLRCITLLFHFLAVGWARWWLPSVAVDTVRELTIEAD